MNQENHEQEAVWLTIQQLYHKHKIAPPTQAKYRKQRRDYLACLKMDSSDINCQDMQQGIPYYKQCGKIYYKRSEIDAWIESGKVV